MCVECLTAVKKKDIEIKREQVDSKTKVRIFARQNLKKQNILTDPHYESDLAKILASYLKGIFVFDFLANIPIFFYEMGLGYPTSDS